MKKINFIYAYYRNGRIVKYTTMVYQLLVRDHEIIKIVSMNGELMWEPQMKNAY